MAKDFWTRDDEESGEGISIRFRKDASKKVTTVLIEYGGNTLEISTDTFEQAVRDYALAKAGVK